jgi:hypothetical protein
VKLANGAVVNDEKWGMDTMAVGAMVEDTVVNMTGTCQATTGTVVDMVITLVKDMGTTVDMVTGTDMVVAAEDMEDTVVEATWELDSVEVDIDSS